MSKSEDYITQINSNVFFQEFTFSKNKFCPSNSSVRQELELADNIVWLDDLLFVYQIKDRNKEKAGSTSDEVKWFENKILKKAVNQIKNTIDYLHEYPEITIENERGYNKNIVEAKTAQIGKIIIYNPSSSFPEEKRFKKFYKSRKVGFIHLFHVEDYLWICKYLMTPPEIYEYLIFREELCTRHQVLMDNYPEQYVLGHFLETDDPSEIEPKYVENLKKFKQDHSNIELIAILELFRENTMSTTNKDEYTLIVKEIAKLNRNEFAEFKKRFFLLFKQSEEEDLITPNRVAYPRTGCGFVFISLPQKHSGQWKIGLNNFTLAHKYDQQLDKCIGIVVFKSCKEKGSHEVFWEYAEFEWSYNVEMEKTLKDNFPFRKVKHKMVNRYIFE